MKKLLSVLIILFLSFWIIPISFGEENCKYKVINDKYDTVWEIATSPNWKEFSFTAVKDWNDILVRDGKEIDTYDYPSFIKYSNDSKSLFYNATLGKEKIFVELKDWKDKITKYPLNGSDISYSLNWDSIAFKVKKDNWKYVVRKDDKDSLEYQNIFDIIYSPKWNSFVFLATKDWKTILVKDEKEIWKEYDKIIRRNISFSLDWNHLTFIANKDWKNFVVKDWEKLWEKYANVAKPFFLDNWESFMYTWNKDWKWFVVLNWKELGWYDNINSPIFSLDKKHYSSLVKENGKYFFLIDGKEIWKEYDNVLGRTGHFSKSGDKFVFTAEKDWKFFLVENWIKIWEDYEYMTVWRYLWEDLLSLKFINKKMYINQRICDWDRWNDLIRKNNNNLKIIEIPKRLLFKQLALSKKELKKTSKGINYISQIDLISEKLSIDKLVKLYNRIWKIKEKYENNPSDNYKKLKDILDYLEAKIWQRLYKEESVEKIEK